jgi:shikimate 5-dehydrogenase
MGVTAVDGGSMLIHQGAVAFERWLDIEAPLDVMFAQLRGPKAI